MITPINSTIIIIGSLVRETGDQVKEGTLKLKDATCTVSLAIGGAVKASATKTAEVIKEIFVVMGESLSSLARDLMKRARSVAIFVRAVFSVLFKGTVSVPRVMVQGYRGVAFVGRNPGVSAGALGSLAVIVNALGTGGVLALAIATIGVLTHRTGWRELTIALVVPAAVHVAINYPETISSIAAPILALATNNPAVAVSVVGVAAVSAATSKYQLGEKAKNAVSAMMGALGVAWASLKTSLSDDESYAAIKKHPTIM